MVTDVSSYLHIVQKSCRRNGITKDSGQVIFTVADRGAGIVPEQRARALERFERLDASRTKPGFGLGLSLAKAVATIHNGTLALTDNAPGLAVIMRLPVDSTGGSHGKPGTDEPGTGEPATG